jgi:dTDP-4-amino-4,6-dideoxygalactose transaminase
MSVPDTTRHTAKTVVFEEYPEVGFNYRMTDVQAAVGAVQLRRLPGVLARRVELAQRYTRALADVPGLVPPHVPEYARTNYQSYPVRVRPEYPLTRDELMQVLLDHRVATRRGIMNAHQEAAYAGAGPYHLPASETARDHTILLPLYHSMTDEDQEYVIDQLRGLAVQRPNGGGV